MPTERRVPGLLAAAATVVLVAAAATVGAYLIAPTERSAPGPAASPTASSTSFTGSELETGDPFFRLGPDQVPSIAGLGPRQAQALLESRGYRVMIAKRSACPSAGDTSVVPTPGTILAAGSTVTLHETQAPSPNLPCPSGDRPDDRVTAFLAWARGLGAMPRLADTVRVEFASHDPGPGHRVTLRGTDIDDPSSWPGLASLRTVLAAPVRSGHSLIPLVATRRDATCSPPPGGACPDWPGAQLAGSAADTAHRTDTSPQFDVALQMDEAGRIARVTLDDRRTPQGGLDPDVVGDSTAYATARLRAFGFDVTTVDTDSCVPRGQVVATAAAGVNGVTVRVSRGDEACAG